MSAPDANRLVADSLSLPTIPAIVRRVQALVDDPDASLREIGAVVSEDPPTAAKVLRIANSAYYGLREPCISPEHATAVLGPRVLRNLVLQATVLESFEHLQRPGSVDVVGIWLHSTQVARAAEQIARLARKRLALAPEEFYACGLVHDLGKVALLENLGSAFVELWRRAEEPGVELHDLERQTFGCDHTDVGALIGERWGLPEPVVQAIQHHHAPTELVAEDPALAVVVAANRLAHALEGAAVTDPARAVPRAIASVLGLRAPEIAAVVERVDLATEPR